MISDSSVFFSLAIGVALGFFLVINKVIVARKRRKGLMVFFADFTFAAICIVVTFMAAIPINRGKIRFFQVALQLIGMAAFYLVFADPALALWNGICRLKAKLKGAVSLRWQGIRKRCRQAREKRKNISPARKKQRSGKEKRRRLEESPKAKDNTASFFNKKTKNKTKNLRKRLDIPR